MKRPDITPGEWSVWPSVEGVVVTDDKLARHIAHIRMATPEWKADARAIAALPALLEALETELYNPEQGVNQKVKTALTLAGYQFDT